MIKLKKYRAGNNVKTFVGKLFRPHGTYSEEIEGQVIHADITGPFNFEMILEFGKQMLPLIVEAKLGGSFVILGEFHESMMTTPEVIASLAASIALIAKKMPQLIGIAHVAIQSVEGRGVMDRIFTEKIYGPIGIAYRLFDNGEAAQIWLHSLLSKRTP